MILSLDDEEEYILQKILSLIEEVTQSMRVSVETEMALSYSGLTILPEQRCVFRENKEIVLNRLEFQLLYKMAKHPKRIFTRAQLCQELYNVDDVTYDNALNCLVSSLRKKLEYNPAHPEYIQTVRDVGYKFVIPGE